MTNKPQQHAMRLAEEPGLLPFLARLDLRAASRKGSSQIRAGTDPGWEDVRNCVVDLLCCLGIKPFIKDIEETTHRILIMDVVLKETDTVVSLSSEVAYPR